MNDQGSLMLCSFNVTLISSSQYFRIVWTSTFGACGRHVYFQNESATIKHDQQSEAFDFLNLLNYRSDTILSAAVVSLAE